MPSGRTRARTRKIAATAATTRPMPVQKFDGGAGGLGELCGAVEQSPDQQDHAVDAEQGADDGGRTAAASGFSGAEAPGMFP
jgi:hypothetical protein